MQSTMTVVDGGRGGSDNDEDIYIYFLCVCNNPSFKDREQGGLMWVLKEFRGCFGSLSFIGFRFCVSLVDSSS